MFEQTGDEEYLLPFAIRNKIYLTVKNLRGICTRLNVRPAKLPGQKSINKYCYAVALVRHLFPKEDEGTLQMLIDGLARQTRSADEQPAWECDHLAAGCGAIDPKAIHCNSAGPMLGNPKTLF